jgi:hypothetical protein
LLTTERHFSQAEQGVRLPGMPLQNASQMVFRFVEMPAFE